MQNALNTFLWVHGTLIIGVNSLLILIVVLILLVKRKNRNTTVMLEITSGGACVTIPITYFPLCPLYWKIQPPITIQKLSLENLSSTKLNIDWPGFTVTNKLTKQNLKIHTKVKLGFYKYFKVRRILKQHCCAYILIVHKVLAFHLRERDESASRAPNSKDNANSLYSLLLS